MSIVRGSRRGRPFASNPASSHQRTCLVPIQVAEISDAVLPDDTLPTIFVAKLSVSAWAVSRP